ncbi:hypothetical protein Bca4012_015936 [Brassica carinata]
MEFPWLSQVDSFSPTPFLYPSFDQPDDLKNYNTNLHPHMNLAHINGSNNNNNNSNNDQEADLEKKLNHNASERDRRRKLNALYASLRALLPDQKRKLSIPKIVGGVVKYIPEQKQELQRLSRRKEELLKIISIKTATMKHQQKQLKNRAMMDSIDSSSQKIAANWITDTEIAVQIATSKWASISDMLLTLEENGLNVISVSSSVSSTARIFYTLHLQVTYQRDLKRAYDEPSTESSSSLFKANGLASSPLPEPTSLSFSSPPLLISLPSSQVLEGLDPVRKRPGMYIGSTGPDGLHHLVYEILDNAIDEAQAGYASKVDVVLHSDGSVSIMDDGRGIPTDFHPATKKSSLETVLTVLHAGGKFGGTSSGYTVSGGLHGVGLSVVNALSEALEVTVWRDGMEHKQTYSRGKPITTLTCSDLPLESKGTKGTSIRFWPDKEVFTTAIEFDHNTIAGRIRDLAFLNPKDPIHDVLGFRKEINGATIDVALQWCADAYSDTMRGFANSIRTMDGGTHIEGMKASLTRTLNALAKKSKAVKEKDINLKGEHVREGLTCIVSVKIPNPEFEGQTKSVQEYLTEYLELHPDVLKSIISKSLNAYKAALAATRARDSIISKSVLKSSSLPGKLSDCSSKNPEESETFIVEGDSAGGSAKQGRDRRFQAILPLRGKILNIEREDEAAMYENEEIQNLIVALGLGVKGENFKLENLRYHKIIILTDADVDGAHIWTLLLTFFFRYQRALFDAGCIYVGVPPLFKILKKITASFPENASYSTQRFKGLGEMMPEQLWETTMNPETRILKQLVVDDIAEANMTFSSLMGARVDVRKELIKNAATRINLQHLDI